MTTLKSNYKTACILIDKNDLIAFRGPYKYALPKQFCWFPVGYSPIMQLIWQKTEEKYYLPRVVDENECSALTEIIYKESQKFLKQLCLTNNMVGNCGDSFPLEYFWLLNWIGTYRIIAYCNDLLNQCPVKEVFLIERNKLENLGGLLVNAASFANLVREFFEKRGVEVKCLNYEDSSARPRTIFYSQSHNWKSFFLHVLKFVRWKVLSFNKKNHDYILINPGRDNVINYRKTFADSSRKLFPQVFHGERMPFLHSWNKLLRFLLAKTFFKRKLSGYDAPVVKTYYCKFLDFEFDFAERFRGTIVQYLKDVRWMKNYIDLFWRTCLDNDKRYLVIFSLSPVFLDAYFIIKKTKEVNGKVAVWQHGGLYDYADHFIYYVQDYKLADYILSFGRGSLKDVTRFAGDSSAACIQVGTEMIYAKSISGNSVIWRPSNSQGLFIPMVIASSYWDNRIKWQAPLYFGSLKKIIDFFDSDQGGKLLVKGLKEYKPHLELRKELRRYIERKRSKSILYSDISLPQALAGNPKFVILDCPSTALLEVLAQYAGPVFLINSQESFAIREDALSLLKRRVVYSRSVDELKVQLTDFFKTGALEGVDTENSSFLDVYAKRFCYREYERFLKIGT